MAKILFVCTGNTCRSPMAEYLFRNLLKESEISGIEASSAGVSAVPGLEANEKAIRVLEEREIDLSGHRTTPVEETLLKDVDLILTMTEDHKHYLSEMGINRDQPVFTLREFVDKEDPDITDPFGQSLAVYRKTRNEIQAILHELLDKLSYYKFEEGNIQPVQNNIIGSDNRIMKIAIGSDHAGYEMKEAIKKQLDAMDVEYKDMGTDSDQSVDYPDYAYQVASGVAGGNYDRGILICGTGIGMSISANKVDGIRAALCHDIFSARATRKHNNTNVLTIGARVIGIGLAQEIVSTWLEADFDGGRHQRRVDKMTSIERGEYS